MTQLRQKMLEELQRRNYSHRTAKTYVQIVREFAEQSLTRTRGSVRRASGFVQIPLSQVPRRETLGLPADAPRRRTCR